MNEPILLNFHILIFRPEVQSKYPNNPRWSTTYIQRYRTGPCLLQYRNSNF